MKLIIMMGVLIILFCVGGIFAFSNYAAIQDLKLIADKSYTILKDGEWTCVAQQCTDWAYGDDWIVENCRPTGENKSLVCGIEINNQKYNAPLSMINLSSVKSCREYQCLTEVYIKGSIGDKI